MSSLKALGGTSDILPEEAAAWQTLEEKARRVLNLYGYQEIRTPLIEEAVVFTRSLGAAAEIVTKQMYLFEDRGGRSVALRPEGTAPVVRAFIEHGLDKTASVSRFYYLGPMFRAERPQAGRRRQFHQLGIEVFGSASPYQDVEVLCLLRRLLEEWGLTGWTLRINSLGCREDRGRMVEQVRRKMTPHRARLCEECRGRLEKNPLRILDCKEKECARLSREVDLLESVCADCRGHFDRVTQSLQSLQLPFERDPHLVRGLDYYTRTAFEVSHGGLGAHNALGGGGRYDDLVAQMGGTTVPAIGFAVGLERILMAREAESGRPPAAKPWDAFVATVGPGQIGDALALAESLRGEGIRAFANLEERSLRRQLEQASKWIPDGRVLILGEDEVARGTVTVRDMSTGKQEQVRHSELARWVKGK